MEQLIFLFDKKQGKFVDRTDEVDYGPEINGKVQITFRSNGRTFSYGKDKVHCYPLRAKKENVKVYQQGIPMSHYNRVYDFGEYIQLENESGQRSTILKKSDVVVDEQRQETQQTIDVLGYFKEIVDGSEFSQTETDEEEISEKSLSQITQGILSYALSTIDTQCSINVLHDYLNQELPTRTVDNSTLIYPFGCNESQKRATEKALCSNLSIIEGPPGTGKTQTILNIIANLLMRDQNVAIVSNNNSAIDNVAEKLTKKGYGGILAGLGSKENCARFFATRDADYIPDTSWLIETAEQMKIQSRIAELSHLIDELFRKQNKLSELRTQLLDARHEYRHVVHEQSISPEQESSLDRLFLRILTSERALRFRAFVEGAQHKEDTLSIVGRVQLLFQFGVWKQGELLKDSDMLTVYANHRFYRMQIEELTHQINVLEQWLARQGADAIVAEYTQLSEKLLQGKLARRENLHSGDFTADNYKSRYDEFSQCYPIILSTTYSLKSCVPRDYLFDYVIIDESSQVDIITASICCSCCKNIIVVGDSQQLTHIIEEQRKKRSEQLLQSAQINDSYDYVKHNILTSLKSLYKDQIPTTLLREHYRCHPLIIGFCNRKFYDNELVIMTKSNGNYPFKVISTNVSGDRKHPTSGSWYSQRQIDATGKYLESATIPSAQIGVIAPYKYHTQLLQNSLPRGVEADTIHKFQGREKEMIVFNTVRGHITPFMDNPNLMNVAVSRAIHQLVVIKPEHFTTPHGSNIGDLLRYIRYTSDNLQDVFIQSNIRSVFDLLYKEYAAILEQYRAKRQDESTSVAEHLMSDLLGQILSEQEEFGIVKIAKAYTLKDLIKDTSVLSDEECLFIRRNSHVDFLFYNCMDNSPILALEVDGVSYHRFNDKQIVRDRIKDHILERVGLPLLRLSTNGSGEKQQIVDVLKKAMSGCGHPHFSLLQAGNKESISQDA